MEFIWLFPRALLDRPDMGRHHDLGCRKLARQNHCARKFSQAGSCRDSRILKNRNTTGFAVEPTRANEGRDDAADRPGAVATRSQVRKNTNQRTPRIRTARPVEMANNASID